MGAWEDFMYGTFGVHQGDYAKKDYYDLTGSKVKPQIASTLRNGSQAKYDSMARQTAENYAGARQRSLASAKGLGLSKSGLNYQTQMGLNAAQANEQSDAYANLLMQDQQFYDQVYALDRQATMDAEMLKRSEAYARQKFWQEAILKGASAGLTLAMA